MDFRPVLLICFSVVLLIATRPGNAQILNADRFGQRAQSAGTLQGEVDFGFNIAKEKETILKLNNSGDFSVRLENTLFVLANEVEFLRTAGENFLNGGFIHFRNRNLLLKFWNPELFLQYQWIGVRGLENRALAGSNLRLRIMQDKNGNLFWAIGVMYEFERWSYSAVDPPKQPANKSPVNFERIKWTSYLSFSRKFNPTISLSLITYYQCKLDDLLFDPRISVSTELNFGISDLFAFSVKYSSFYDSKPSVPIDKFFFSMTNSLSFHFK